MKTIILFLSLFWMLPSFAGETRFFVNGLSCPFCARSIEKAFGEIEGYEVDSVKVVSLKTGEVAVTTKGKGTLPKDVLTRELKETDFSLRESKKKQ